MNAFMLSPAEVAADVAGADPLAGAADPPLGAVVCPLIARELPHALANLKRWNDDLPPGPPLPGLRRPRLVFSFNGARDDTIVSRLVDGFAAAPLLSEAFDGMEVRFLDLPPEKDQYIKRATGPAPKYGFKSGPNWMFYETIRSLRGEARFVFLMEVDCTPLVPNWLRRLTRACARHDDAWVLGAHYSGASPLLPRVARHINGNALYNVGDPEFAAFLDETLWPWMLDHIEHHDPDLAYDCAWETFLNRAEMGDLSHHDWIASRAVLHKFRLIDTVVNVGGHAEQMGHYVWTRYQLLQRFPQAAVAHGPVSLGGEHRRGRFNIGRPLLSGARVEGKRLVLVADEAEFSRSVWPSAGALEPGERVCVGFAVRAHPDQLVAIDLREPSGAIVERRKAFAKPDGTRRVKMEFTLPRRYNYFSVVLSTIRQSDGAPPILIDELTVAVGKGETGWQVRDFAAD